MHAVQTGGGHHMAHSDKHLLNAKYWRKKTIKHTKLLLFKAPQRTRTLTHMNLTFNLNLNFRSGLRLVNYGKEKTTHTYTPKKDTFHIYSPIRWAKNSFKFLKWNNFLNDKLLRQNWQENRSILQLIGWRFSFVTSFPCVCLSVFYVYNCTLT